MTRTMSTLGPTSRLAAAGKQTVGSPYSRPCSAGPALLLGHGSGAGSGSAGRRGTRRYISSASANTSETP